MKQPGSCGRTDGPTLPRTRWLRRDVPRNDIGGLEVPALIGQAHKAVAAGGAAVG